MTFHLQKPDLYGRFPHLLPYERQIWRRFLASDPHPLFRVAYDLHVGKPAPIKSTLPPNYQKMIRYLSTKRIDVVMFFPDEIIVLEVKRHAGLTAIGQALSYRTLFSQKYHPTLPVRCAILTDAAQPDLPMLCNTHNVILLELETLDIATVMRFK